MQAAVPDGNNEVVLFDGKRACQVYRVRSAESMAAGKVASALLDFSGQLYLPSGCPELFPGPFRIEQFIGPKLVISCGRGQRGPNFGESKAA